MYLSTLPPTGQFHFWILNNNDPLNRIFCLESVANGSYYLHWDKLNHKVDLKVWMC